MSVIKLVGIELEGGWDEAPDAPIHGDGSVTASGEYDSGEISSPPLRREDVESFIVRNYPQNVNPSCGLHVHTSLKSVGRYQQLMSEDFFAHWKNQMRLWGERYPVHRDSQFWQRLAGRNTYCRDSFQAEEQAEATSKWDCRYSMLNFCWTLHGTLEARVLPMFKRPATAIAAVNRHLDIIEEYLSKRRIRRYLGSDGVEYPAADISPVSERVESEFRIRSNVRDAVELEYAAPVNESHTVGPRFSWQSGSEYTVFDESEPF